VGGKVPFRRRKRSRGNEGKNELRGGGGERDKNPCSKKRKILWKRGSKMHKESERKRKGGKKMHENGRGSPSWKKEE